MFNYVAHYLPQIVCVVGLILYLLTTKPKAVECGRLMFWSGLFVTMLRGIK